MSAFLCKSVEEAKATLGKYGVAVLADVMPASACDTYRAGYEDWLKTFPADKIPYNESEQSLVQSYNIAHHPCSWAVRVGVKHVFAELWGTEKLHSSTDGIAIGQPPEYGKNAFEEVRPGRINFHIDQGPHKEGLHAYQGALYLEQAEVDDWCFQVLLGSHEWHKLFFEVHGGYDEEEEEYRRLTAEEQQWFTEQGCREERVTVPKGGLLLWDSRTVHGGAPVRIDRQHKDRWRFVVFVSMTPALWSTPADIHLKRKGYHGLNISRHWSSQNFELFETHGTSPQDISELPDAAKTRDARLLVGDLLYDFEDGKPNGPSAVPKTIPF